MRLPGIQALLTEDSGTGNPKTITLPHGWRVSCFQGKHRIAAARQWLSPIELWWNFNVYDTEKLNEDCRKKSREFETGSQSFSDGEIYRNVRHYQLKGDIVAANKWLARWSTTKCREFNRIYQPKGAKAEFAELSISLDSLSSPSQLYGPLSIWVLISQVYNVRR